jgi:hypothetical protein
MVTAAAVPYRVLYITIPSPPSPTPDVALIVRSKIPGRELRYVFVLDLFYKSQYAVGLYQPFFSSLLCTANGFIVGSKKLVICCWKNRISAFRPTATALTVLTVAADAGAV